MREASLRQAMQINICIFSVLQEAAALFAVAPLITYQQGQTGLSTVSIAHSLAVDWFCWVSYKLHSLWINRTPKNNPCTYEVTNQ